MRMRRNSLALVMLSPIMLLGSPHADESAAHEETLTGIDELIGVIATSYDCAINDYTVSTIHMSDETSYLVKAKSFGARCDEALHMLNYRGKSRRWFFSFVDTMPRSKAPEDTQNGGRNQDLIHEIDPKGAS